MFIQKFIVANLVLAIGVFLVSPTALAQEPTSVATSSNLTNATSTTQASSTPKQEIKQLRQAALGVARQQRVLNLAANLSNRFDAASNRLLAIVTRLESRIVKLNNANFDTTAASEELRVAAKHIAAALTTLGNIDKQVNDATTSTEPQNKWRGVFQSYKEAAISLRAAQTSLKQVVALLKNTTPVISEPATATSTASTTE
jgi:exonuclease VII small subunit